MQFKKAQSHFSPFKMISFVTDKLSMRDYLMLKPTRGPESRCRGQAEYDPGSWPSTSGIELPLADVFAFRRRPPSPAELLPRNLRAFKNF